MPTLRSYLGIAVVGESAPFVFARSKAAQRSQVALQQLQHAEYLQRAQRGVPASAGY